MCVRRVRVRVVYKVNYLARDTPNNSYSSTSNIYEQPKSIIHNSTFVAHTLFTYSNPISRVMREPSKPQAQRPNRSGSGSMREAMNRVRAKGMAAKGRPAIG